MKNTKIKIALSVLFLSYSLYSSAQEYDDLYFFKSDRKKVKYDEGKSQNVNYSSETSVSDYQPKNTLENYNYSNSFSARQVNPEFIAQYQAENSEQGSGTAPSNDTFSSEDYFIEDYQEDVSRVANIAPNAQTVIVNNNFNNGGFNNNNRFFNSGFATPYYDPFFNTFVDPFTGLPIYGFNDPFFIPRRRFFRPGFSFGLGFNSGWAFNSGFSRGAAFGFGNRFFDPFFCPPGYAFGFRNNFYGGYYNGFYDAVVFNTVTFANNPNNRVVRRRLRGISPSRGAFVSGRNNNSVTRQRGTSVGNLDGTNVTNGTGRRSRTDARNGRQVDRNFSDAQERYSSRSRRSDVNSSNGRSRSLNSDGTRSRRSSDSNVRSSNSRSRKSVSSQQRSSRSRSSVGNSSRSRRSSSVGSRSSGSRSRSSVGSSSRSRGSFSSPSRSSRSSGSRSSGSRSRSSSRGRR